MTHRPSGGWVAPRILREHLEGPLFADWRLRAWVCMCADADYDTGELRSTCRELALRFDASKSTFARWLTEMEASGYIRRSALGEGPRDGMTLIVVYISDREPAWDNRWDKTGTNGGTNSGTNKSSNGAGFSDGGGTIGGTIGGTKPGQTVGHVLSKEKEENSLPTGERNTHTRTRTREDAPKPRPSKRCPVEWHPNDEHKRLALSLGVDLNAQLEVLRDYTFATAKSDWDATFRNWLRKAAEKHGHGNGSAPTATSSGEDSGELQRRRQEEAQRLETEHQNEKQAWKRAIAERWEAEAPEVRDRIRAQAEAEFASLRGDELRFKRAVDPRAVQLYAEEINLPAPKKRTA